jgi:hypothetical protein
MIADDRVDEFPGELVLVKGKLAYAVIEGAAQEIDAGLAVVRFKPAPEACAGALERGRVGHLGVPLMRAAALL